MSTRVHLMGPTYTPRMDTDALLAFVRFHAWANDRIMTTAAGLSEEEFRRAALLDHGTALQTLRHLVDVDWSWREFCTGNDIGQAYVWDSGSCSRICRRSTRSASRRTTACGATWGRSRCRAQRADKFDDGASVPRWLILAPRREPRDPAPERAWPATSPNAGTRRASSTSSTRAPCEVGCHPEPHRGGMNT